MNPQATTKTEAPRRVYETHATVYCPICTHTVDATVISNGKVSKTKPGQKCARCAASLDAGYIMWQDRAA